MAGKNKKNELDFIKEIEAYDQQKREALEQLKAYQKSQTDKLGQLYFVLKKLENPDLSIDDLVVDIKVCYSRPDDEVDDRKLWNELEIEGPVEGEPTSQSC